MRELVCQARRASGAVIPDPRSSWQIDRRNRLATIDDVAGEWVRCDFLNEEVHTR